MERKDYFATLRKIKAIYDYRHDDIIARLEESKFAWVNPYLYNWHIILTPIEFEAWCSIRSKGRIVLYPQYPVANMFVDFGNPVQKIALELDGKAYHKIEKDKQRDIRLKELGWTVYRISGSEMNSLNYMLEEKIDELRYEDEKEEAYRHWLLNTGDGVIEAIKIIHFDGDYYGNYMYDYAIKSLNNHRLI